MSKNAGRSEYAIAVSFANEDRAFVIEVATQLATTFGRDRVFYDDWHEAKLVGRSGDVKLKEQYREHSQLIVPFFSEHYLKMWCQEEWKTIRAVMIERRDEDAVVPVELDDTKIDGWDINDFAIRRRDRDATAIAREITKAWQSRFGRDEQAGVHPVMPTWKRILDRRDQTATARYEVEEMMKSGRPDATCLCWHGEEESGLAHLHDRLVHELKDVAKNRFLCVRPLWPATKKRKRAAFREMMAQCLNGSAPVAGDQVRIQELGQWIRQAGNGSSQRELLLVDHPVIEDEKLFCPEDLLDYLQWWDEILEYLEPNQHVVLNVSFITDNDVHFLDQIDRVVGVSSHPYRRLVFSMLPVLHMLEPKELRDFCKKAELNIDMTWDEQEELIANIMDKTKGVYEAVMDYLDEFFKARNQT